VLLPLLQLVLLQPLRLIARSRGAVAADDEDDAVGRRPITELTTPRAAHGLAAAPTTATPSVTVV